MFAVAARRCSRWQPRAGRAGSLPLVLLVVVSLLSLGARVAWLGEPCRAPCNSPTDHLLIFDEDYYVNAARVIAGIRPPERAPYATAPLGVDPNSEHPPLAKLIIAGSIELFGDGPIAWRLGSIVFGTLAILGMFALARAAGAGRWVALGAAALMASDNLLLVHSRIGTLDIYALAGMVWGAVLYVRRRPLLGGVVIGIATCAKEVAPLAVLALALFEGLSWLEARGELRPWLRLRRIGLCAIGTVGAFVSLLALLGRIAPPWDPETGRLVGGPFAEIAHIISYGAQLTSPHGPRGIASYPWQWLGDYKPITYLNINPSHPTAALNHIHPAVHFLGMISPPILLLALPSLAFVAWGLAVHRHGVPVRRGARSGRLRAEGSEVGVLGLAWFIGTFLPFELASAIESRTSYLYYMVIVMPGIYLSVAHLIDRVRPNSKLTAAWIVSVVIAAILMYPFTPLP